MYSSTTIANYFVLKAKRAGVRLTPVKLEQLVFLAHGWFLANRGNPLTYDVVEAWTFGPVVQPLFFRVARRGNRPIRRRIIEPDKRRNGEKLLPDVEEFLDLCWTTYGNMSDSELLWLVTRPGTPWAEARAEHPYIRYGLRIGNESIQAHYAAQLDNREPAYADSAP